MRLSSKTSYAVDALFDLAFHGQGRAAQARDIAERQELPVRYLEQILQDLRRAGLVEARRGPGGGYVLARPAAAICIADVVTALEGPLSDPFAPFAPLAPEDPDAPARRRSRARGATDVTAGLWRELGTKVEALYTGVTIQDLVTRARGAGLEPAPAPARPTSITGGARVDRP
jgi:Rrf2 family protein